MRFSLPITVAAFVLLVAACSSTSPSATSPHSATMTSSARVDPNAGLPTGTQVKALLAPASWFPRGFKIDPQSSVNTGSNYQPTTPTGVRKCSRLHATAWVQLGNGGAVSFAQNVYFNQNAGQYSQEINVYQGSTAQDVMAKLRQAAARCRSFHDAQTSSTVTVTRKTGPQLGDDALTIRLRNPRWLGGMTLEAVRVGHAVATVYFSAASGTGEAQATKLAAVLTANLQKNG